MTEWTADDRSLLNTREKFIKAYGREFGELVFAKADAPLTTGTSGNLYQLLGAKLWMQLNTEQNLFAMFKSEAWGTNADGWDGWRVVTDYPSPKGVFMGEMDNLADDVIYGFDQLFDKPKTVDTKFSNTELAYREARRRQAVMWNEYVKIMGLAHKLFLCEGLAVECGDNDATTDFNPIDQLISNYDEFTNCATINAKGDAASKFYQQTVDRSGAAGYSDAYVDHNSEVLRQFTIYTADDLIKGVREQCGVYDTSGYAFLTGIDTMTRWKQLARPHKMFTNEKFANVPGAGLRQVSGQGFGFSMNRYDNIPILASKHITDALRPATGLTPIYLIHLPDITFWVDVPTVYYERGMQGGDDIYLNAHKVVGLYHTMGNLHAYKFLTHGKARDLKEV